MIWNFIVERLNVHKRVAVMCVLHSSGSSPGRQGFKMAISENGDMYGSIGGGIMEYKLVELAKNRLQEANYTPEVFLQVHDKHAPHQSGMICSGEQTIFLCILQPNDLSVVQKISDSFQHNRGETLLITKLGIQFDEVCMAQPFFVKEGEHDFVYKEKTGKKHVLHIVGGGHCALALSKLMSEMDFVIKIYEEREKLNTLQHNHYVDKKIILDSYSKLGSFLNANDDDFVIIMTFGYRTDDIALRSIANRKFRYLGLLGSKKKIERLMAQYRAEHFDNAWLKGIYAPAGVFIKSETPQEIAVSIAGEIILMKNAF